jgi:peptide chain release factor 2
MRKRVQEARQYLNFEQIRAQVKQLEARSSEPGFWDAAAAAQEHMRLINRLKLTVDPWEKLEGEVSDALELAEMASGDAAMMAELAQTVGELAHRLEGLETRALMKEPEDINNTYFNIHAGAGGTEACDWAAMLLRMYARWCERTGYQVEMIEYQDGEEAGVRSATLLVKGDYAYGQLKAEIGVHRLVRISPFDANKRRHTSFCSVYASPEVDDSIDIEIREEDLKIDTYRSSGAGGQHVNKTSSAVRITHLPSKIVVACQNERSQHQNKAVAMKMLRSRLYTLEIDKRKAEQAVRESEKKDISWGNQIRSYVFQPYQLVKDLRTGCETGNIIAVMDGDLDGFIEAFLRWNAGMPGEKNGNSVSAADLAE